MTDIIFKLLTSSLINCTKDGILDEKIPTAKEFLQRLELPFIIPLIIGTILSLATIVMGILHFVHVGFYVTNVYRRTFILYLAGTAPFISSFALSSMYMPRISFLSHLLSFFYFSIALYVIICLLLHIVEGKQSIVRKMNQTSLRITFQTPPFCCVFPCLPKLPMEMRKIRFCELMVIQSPCTRLVATILSLVLYFEYRDASFIALKVLDFIFLPSLLVGIYGCHILVTTISKLDELCPYRYIYVFRLLDIFFMFFGLQQPIFDCLARAGLFGCGLSGLPALDTAFFWKNFLTVCESFLVSIISTQLLKPPQSALFDKHPSCRSVVSSITLDNAIIRTEPAGY